MNHINTLILLGIVIFAGCKKNDVSFPCNCDKKPLNYAKDSSRIVMPNAFTPNNDGRNDRFLIIKHENIVGNFELTVYQDGQPVFTTTSSIVGWDGSDNNGDTIKSGRYYYKINFTTASGNAEELCGCVHLFRFALGGCMKINNPSDYYFHDQFDRETGELKYDTGEKFCP